MSRRTGVPGYLRPTPRHVLRLRPAAWTVIAAAVVLAAVEVVAHSGQVSPLDLVPVETMATRAAHLITDGYFLKQNVLRSAVVILISFAAASVLGCAVALAMYSNDWIRRAVAPFVTVYYAIPVFALYPVIVVIFGTGVTPIAVTATAFAMVVVIVSALAGFDSVPPVVDKLATSLRLSRPQYFRMILVRSALPDIAMGVKLGLAYSIIAVLATEFILSTQGLGWFISQSYQNFATDDMYGSVLIVAALVFVANVGLSVLLRRFDWRRRRA
jgi:NitT/TauT family transport system permease protein